MRFRRRQREPYKSPDQVRREMQAAVADGLFGQELPEGEPETHGEEASRPAWRHTEPLGPWPGRETPEEPGIWNDGGTVNIDRTAIGGQVSGRVDLSPWVISYGGEMDLRGAAFVDGAEHYIVNTGGGQVNVERSAFGDGATVINYDREAGE